MKLQQKLKMKSSGKISSKFNSVEDAVVSYLGLFCDNHRLKAFIIQQY